MSRYDVNVILYKLKKDAAFRTRFQASPQTVLAGADLSDEEREAFVRWDTAPPQRAGRLAAPARLHSPPRRPLTR